MGGGGEHFAPAQGVANQLQISEEGAGEEGVAARTSPKYANPPKPVNCAEGCLFAELFYMCGGKRGGASCA